jgi:hypothetical protein
MTSWPLRLVLMLIATIAIAVPSLVVARHDHAAMARATLLTRLQTLAGKSCKCARRTNNASGKAECWHRFDVAAAPELDPNGGEGETACAPLSTRSVQLRDGDEVVKSYDIIVAGGDGAFCTRAEAMAAERAFEEEPGIETPTGTIVSFDPLFALSRAYARNEPAAETRYPGCAGGHGSLT